MSQDVIEELTAELDELDRDLLNAQARSRLRGELVAVTQAAGRAGRIRAILSRAGTP
jgi:hypothetical protein